MRKNHQRRHRSVQSETAVNHLVADLATATPEETVANACERVRDLDGKGGATSVYVVDTHRKLQGSVAIADLLRLRPEQPLRDVMTPVVLSVAAHTDQEHVATAALRHAALEVPVTDQHGHFIGVVPAAALLQILRHEHIEDLHRMAGITRETAQARKVLEAPPTRRVRDRLPWLLVGLAGSMLATLVVGSFEGSLQAQVAIAFFMPGLVYLTDAIGTQSEAIMVRGLSITRAGPGKLLWGEVRTGFSLGTILGALAFLGVLTAFRDLRLAAAVGLTMICAGTLACTIGTGLPWLLHRSGRDPAFGSGPLATIIQDLLTLLVYFAAVSLLT
jgi:magnesium transporter